MHQQLIPVAHKAAVDTAEKMFEISEHFTNRFDHTLSRHSSNIGSESKSILANRQITGRISLFGCDRNTGTVRIFIRKSVICLNINNGQVKFSNIISQHPVCLISLLSGLCLLIPGISQRRRFMTCKCFLICHVRDQEFPV